MGLNVRGVAWGVGQYVKVNCVTQAACLSLASLEEACQSRGEGKPIV
ncbi:hypothetical protein CHA_P10113c [Pseudomonas phage CHA_P1]|uniref:Uncharacterized protein n=1 Tax=Pseudomonas phage CHA_P1 TaxID=1327965 RepID=V5JVR9_9CAUD|nr:hypothetical protein X837_gp111 [Pseudomonas phage CHA_P1]YP_008858136.1 hypothetical protein X837_gp113 [Pseudomonas phage CHA_P1]AGR89065.1 hypothetical protein CHA_P10111c [Pseudomonas phage CHA_P1]AGR89067.1 hypothetical protein CHA_P10113c [Pseudomonas phage CHA_P1]